MATLTNTKIKDTYVGLLKTTDNQAIDASGVTLVEDGAGNASALSVGRSGNGVTITGNLAVDTDTLYVNSSTSRVGINTNTPSQRLHIKEDDTTAVYARVSNSAGVFEVGVDASGNGEVGMVTADDLLFNTSGSERLRIDSSGNVGIGTSNPDTEMHLEGFNPKFTITNTNTTASGYHGIVFESLDTAGFTTQSLGQIDFVTSAGATGLSARIKAEMSNSSGAGNIVFTAGTAGSPSEVARITGSGLTFNGDTAADNALNDYEEGTWTPTYSTDDGDFDTIDYGTQTGRYTKIGRVVYCDLMLRAGNITYSGSVTSASKVRIGGLPFTSIGGFSVAGGGISFINNWGNTNNPNSIQIQSGTTEVALHVLSETSSRYAVAVSDLDTGAANTRNDIRMSFFYFV